MKIGPVVSAENILIEIALRVHVVVRRMSSNKNYLWMYFTNFRNHFHHMKALNMPMMGLYLILQFVKGVAMATK